MNLKETAYLILLLSIMGCKKEVAISESDRVTAMLISGTWQDPEVTADGVDITDLYRDFSLTFSKNSYSTLAGSPIWNASGTWVFINEQATLLKLDNAREVEINLISDNALELSVQWDQDTFGPGRINSVKGKHKFKLKKKK